MTLFFFSIFRWEKRQLYSTTQSSFNATEQQNVIAKFSAYFNGGKCSDFLQVLLNENVFRKNGQSKSFIKIKKNDFNRNFIVKSKKYIKKKFNFILNQFSSGLS